MSSQREINWHLVGRCVGVAIASCSAYLKQAEDEQAIREQLENLETNWADDLFQNPYASVLTSRLHAERNRLYFLLGEEPPAFLPVDMADYYRSKAVGGAV